MVGRAFQTKEPWNTFPQVHPSAQHPWRARARARAPPPTGEASNLRAPSWSH